MFSSRTSSRQPYDDFSYSGPLITRFTELGVAQDAHFYDVRVRGNFVVSEASHKEFERTLQHFRHAEDVADSSHDAFCTDVFWPTKYLADIDDEHPLAGPLLQQGWHVYHVDFGCGAFAENRPELERIASLVHDYASPLSK